MRRRPFLVLAAALAALGAVAGSGAPARAGPADGAALYRQRCASCHAAPSLAPSLSGVVGRRAGSADFRYSAPLKASDLVWTPSTLDSFLSAPPRLVPGTRMVVSVPDPEQRKAIIAYLARPGA